MKQQFSRSEISTCWVNGKIVSPYETAVSAVDHAIIVGDAVFETIKVIKGIPFALSRHLKRLERSSKGLGIDPPDLNYVSAAINEILNADQNSERLRITWSSGPGPLSSSRGNEAGTLMISSSLGTQWPITERVHLCQWSRNENGALKGIKSTSYAENVLALRKAHEFNCSEAIFLNTAGKVCEGTGTNIFFVIDDHLITPSLESGCLAGITRELIIELVQVEEKDIYPSDMQLASEAFLSSSTREISPISAIDEIILPEAPGPITEDISSKFATLVKSNTDP